ncbi:methyltransferase LaeA [Diaporthe helianthi]|uniref:Methyltransferase LaeA n=1 Tax=Diaporthe helianthi TaxID=158607 RepID=A0A2P5HMT3_DIAHE|nr:methyltransferase LaeA [Diaporthe helianthi]
MATNGYTNGLPQATLNQVVPGKGSYVENGREYQAWHRGQYLFPIDETELDRLDAMHKLFQVARNYRLYSSHIILDNIPNLKVLDLGCGTGMWALDMARKFFKNSLVRGVDLSTQMQASSIFENNDFKAMDIEEPWAPFLGEDYHLIHARMLAGSIHFESWPRIYGEIFSHLIPGSGWVEQVEVDWYPCNDGGPVSHHLGLWAEELRSAMDQMKRPLRIDSNRSQQMLADAGFVDIKQEVIHLPVNGGSLVPFEKDVGRWFNLSLHKSFMGLSMAPLYRVKNWRPEDISRLETDVLEEIADRNNRAYCKL